MRRLIYVPIVHTMADMGSEAETLKMEYIERYGEAAWFRSRQIVEGVWEGITERLRALNLDYRKVRIYQDGLPSCGRELEIVRQVAACGSKNYALILDLLERGALVEGTESPDLLLEEYNFIKRITQAKDEAEQEAAREAYARESSRILKQRDEFISRRIDESLQEGEIGLLFLGLMHQVDQMLPKDIEVSYLIHRLPFQGAVTLPGGA